MGKKKKSRKRRRTIKPLDLDKALKEVLEEFGDDVYIVLDDAVDEIADEAVQKLRSVNHFAPGGHPTGKYSASWTVDDIKKGMLTKNKVIHNAEHYQLAHLLEKGHVIRNGTKRDLGKVKGYKHIKPVEEWVKKELPAKVASKLSSSDL